VAIRGFSDMTILLAGLTTWPLATTLYLS